MRGAYKKADFTVVMLPDHVESECPYCEEVFQVDYDEFMIDGDPYQTEGTTIECPNCEEEILINNVEWE